MGPSEHVTIVGYDASPRKENKMERISTRPTVRTVFQVVLEPLFVRPYRPPSKAKRLALTSCSEFSSNRLHYTSTRDKAYYRVTDRRPLPAGRAVSLFPLVCLRCLRFVLICTDSFPAELSVPFVVVPSPLLSLAKSGTIGRSGKQFHREDSNIFAQIQAPSFGLYQLHEYVHEGCSILNDTSFFRYRSPLFPFWAVGY